jgi:hypothetical protein
MKLQKSVWGVVVLVLFASSFVWAQQYRLLPKRLLDDKNICNYNLTVSGQEDGEAYNGSGTAYFKVTGTDEVNGVPIRKVEFKTTVTGWGWEKDILLWRMTSENLEEYGDLTSSSSREWEDETVRNNNPAEVLPVFVNDTDVDRLFGTGEYSSETSWGETWTGTTNHYITYIGQEQLEVPAGTFDCIHVQVTVQWQDEWYDPDWGSGTSEGEDVYDFWICSISGIIKMDIMETEAGSPDWDSLSVELKSLKVSLPVANEIQKCTVKAGKTDASDSIQLAGLLNAAACDLEDAASEIVVGLESPEMETMEFIFPINGDTYKKGKFNCTLIEDSSQSCFKLDPKNGKMTFSAKNVDLKGLCCPLTVTIEIGDFSAQMELDEDIVNGVKLPCPPQFLMGVRDWLMVDKAQVKAGNKPGTDSLSVKGFFTVADSEYNKANPLKTSLGQQTFTVSGDQFTSKGTSESCNKGACDEEEGPEIKAQFDFAKCTFQIQVKNAVIPDSGEVDFGVECFGNPLPEQTIDIPEPKSPRYELERYRCYNQLGRDWTYRGDYMVSIDTLDELGMDSSDSGFMTGYISVGNSLENIDGHLCYNVSASAADSTVSTAWYEDYYGTHQYTWGNFGGDAIGFEAEMETPLMMPKLLAVGQTFKDSARFTGEYELGLSGLDIYNFGGTMSIATKLEGFEPVTVPYNGNTTFDEAAKVRITQALKGSMVIYIADYDMSIRANFQMTVDQTWWGVEDMGVVKSDTTMSMKLSFAGINILIDAIETDQLTGYSQ